MHFIVVGEDVAYIREDIEQLSAGSEPSEEFTEPYYNRVQPFLARNCFGYLDESNPECQDHCDFQHKCAERRSEILESIAEEISEEEYEMDFETQLGEAAKEIEEIKSNDLEGF